MLLSIQDFIANSFLYVLLSLWFKWKSTLASTFVVQKATMVFQSQTHSLLFILCIIQWCLIYSEKEKQREIRDDVCECAHARCMCYSELKSFLSDVSRNMMTIFGMVAFYSDLYATSITVFMNQTSTHVVWLMLVDVTIVSTDDWLIGLDLTGEAEVLSVESTYTNGVTKAATELTN